CASEAGALASASTNSW
nr:immunoglobulin heavy chain junction region [Macaca mulatta]MOW95803.1 immunoglobulin heavy chain junction region [Macaca mulatta]